jgi:altronate dehydratase
MNTAVVISANDNVATTLESLEAGEQVRAGALIVTTVEAIPRGHKVALRSIPAGAVVIKYGSPIGTAVREIGPGAHVHTHNVVSARGRGDLLNSRQSAVGGEQSASDRSDPRLAEPAE